MYRKQLICNFTGLVPNNRSDLHDRKRIKEEVTQEGVVVNNFIKAPEMYNADSPIQNTPLPKDMFEKKEKIAGSWYNHPLVPIIAAPLLILGVGAGLTKFYKKSLINKYITDEKIRIPAQGRLIAVNNDNTMALLMLVQDPSWKNLQAATAVIAASSTAFIMKNVVDGFKEVLVKKQAADIKRDKEEKLIDIETRSFSGKNQIIRSLISQKAAELNDYEKLAELSDVGNESPLLGFAFNKKKIAFKSANNVQNINESEKKESSKKALLYTALSGAAIVATGLFTKSIFKNLRTVARELTEKASEAGKVLNADLHKLTTTEELEKELLSSNASDYAKDFVRCEWSKIHSPSGFAPTPEFIAGTRGKTGFSSVVLSEASAFIYTWLINKNPQTATLATLMCTAAGLGYLGQNVVKGIKEVQVEKANAKTEVDLQDRLVQVELNNFYQKKNSYVQPLIDDYKEKIKNPFYKNHSAKLKENVISEIKNGPPFVYS